MPPRASAGAAPAGRPRPRARAAPPAEPSDRPASGGEGLLPLHERDRLWWPFETHSIGGEKVETAILEAEEGGRLFERHADGTEHDWGIVTAWDAPNRLALDWRVSPNTYGTEVEVRFTPEGAETRVDLEHRGWEHCGPGSRESYDGGWEYVLGRFVEAA